MQRIKGVYVLNVESDIIRQFDDHDDSELKLSFPTFAKTYHTNNNVYFKLGSETT